MKSKTPEPKLNNAQRQALVELTERRFGHLVEKVRDDNGQLTEQIKTQLKEELGVTAIAGLLT